MKKTRLLIAGFLLPVIITAQGIVFDNSSNWQEVIQKAKLQNKYVFVDFFATWCGPCKKMDRDIYTLPSIGDYFNEKCISLKLQMDSTGKDNDYVVGWRKDADSLASVYNIAAYPTFLFFSPDGELVGRDLGYIAEENFLSLARRTTDPMHNYKFMQDQYLSGKLNKKQMGEFAIMALNMGDKKNAEAAAVVYNKNYLNHLTPNNLVTLQNLDFLVKFQNIIGTKDNFFKVLYRMPEKADELRQQKGFSRSFTDYVVTREIIFPATGEKVNTNLGVNNNPDVKEPDWKKLIRLIGEKYDYRMAERVVQSAKFRWYEYKKDWPDYVKVAIEIGEGTVASDTSFMGKSSVNSIAYSIIFKYSNDTSELNKGIQWMEMLLESYPERYSWIDTYANLLYKSNKVKEAIAMEQKAVDLVKEKGTKEELPEYMECLRKMKEGKTTW